MMDRRIFIKSILTLPFFAFLQPFKQNPEKTRKILLLDTVVAGISYYEAEKIWNTLSVGQPLRLLREPENPFDKRAIEVYRGKNKLGYIPRRDNSVISQMMDRKKNIMADIVWLKQDPDPWKRIGIKVWMEV